MARCLPVDNAALYKAIRKYYRRKTGAPLPDDIGMALWTIAKASVARRNAGHPMQEDMVAAVALNLVRVIMERKFDVGRSRNPFSFLNSVATRTMTDLVRAEMKQAAVAIMLYAESAPDERGRRAVERGRDIIDAVDATERAKVATARRGKENPSR